MNSDFSPDVYAAVAAAEKLIAKNVQRGAGELVPLLADVRALASRPFDARFAEAVDQLSGAFPYYRDKGPSWAGPRNDARFLARLRSAGVHYGDTSEASIDEIWAALGKIRHWAARALLVPSPEARRAAAAANPSQRSLDVGAHRLFFLKPEHGGGFVIDDGWYVPVGEPRAAMAAPRSAAHDYLLVDTMSCALTRSSGGLCLVDARAYRYSRITRDPAPLHGVELTGEGLTISSTSPMLRYDTLTFTACERR
jgi:hypothetical protein